MSLRVKKTVLVCGEDTYRLYRITPPKPELAGLEVTDLSDDYVRREPGDVLDMGESLEAELVYSDEIFAALKAKQAAAAADGTVETWGIVYADETQDPFKGWVQAVGKSEAAVKGEPFKILLTLGIAGPADGPTS